MYQSVNKIILGLDLSLCNTGFAIINTSPLEIVELGHIPTSTSDGDMGKRLKIIGNKLSEIQITYAFDLVAKESCFFSNSYTTTEKLFEVHGLADYIFADYNVLGINPSKIKKFITGSGDANKAQVEEGVKKFFPLAKFATDDESDALAIAIMAGKNKKYF